LIARQLKNLAFVLVAVAVPLLAKLIADRAGVSEYNQNILFKMGQNITLAVGLSLIIGFAGQFSLGHAGLMAVGAFFSGMFSARVLARWATAVDPVFFDADTAAAEALRYLFLLPTLGFGMWAALLAALAVGIPSLRLRGDYLAIATLGFGEITYNLLLIYILNHYSDTAFYFHEVGFMNRTANMATAWALALLSILVVRNLVSSTTGRALPAIREDEIAASAVGIRTTKYKLLAFVTGSVLAGAAGVLEAHQITIVNPASYRFDRSIEVIVPVVLGGSGSLTGCVLAAAVFTYLLERLRDLPAGAQQYRTIVYAAVLILIMILRPQGLMGRWELVDIVRWLGRRFRTRKSGSPPVEARASSEWGGNTQSANLAESGGATLECRALTIRFGGLIAVNNFNLLLGRREIVGLIGPNGAGKTTCFNMITGVYRPTTGDVRLGDQSLVGLGPARINGRGIARTFQNIRLFDDLSVLDNVRIALHTRLKTGIPAAILRTPSFYREEELARAEAIRLLLLFGLERFADEIAGSLPYGAQRRLEIARALATRPKVLCLDEPAAGMNPAEKHDLMELIKHIRDQFQLTILLIEHDMRVVMGVCERITVLDHGETIAVGAPEEIRNNPKVIEAYLGEPAK